MGGGRRVKEGKGLRCTICHLQNHGDVKCSMGDSKTVILSGVRWVLGLLWWSLPKS